MDDEADSIFTKVEKTLIKMIIGVPRFIFWVIPREILALLERALPWIVRLVRLGLLFVIWLGVVIWPFALLRYHNREEVSADYPFGFNIDPLSMWFCLIWFFLALGGSLWGVGYVVLQKRRREKKQRQAQSPR